jgi:hypothetical protein
MVLWLRVNVLQHRLELTWAHRKSAIAALPEKPAVADVKCFDSFRRHLLDLLDQLRLGKRSWQRSDNVNVISNAANSRQVATQITADCCQISMHAWAYV